jgi:hypothetical protein
LIVESFVDAQLFRGTAYKAGGWRALGATAGYARVNEDFYVAHDRPKTLFVRELVKHAARTLRARTLLPEAVPPYGRADRRQRRAARTARDPRAERGPGPDGFPARSATGPRGSGTTPEKRED